jgi:glycine dehydrogenase
MAATFAARLRDAGLQVNDADFFDTVWVDVGDALPEVLERAASKRINLRPLGGQRLSVSFDETVEPADLVALLEVFGVSCDRDDPLEGVAGAPPESIARATEMMTHPLFHSVRSETDMMRYLNRLKSRDLSLTTSMIPLGSCTMKLNAAAEMEPISWAEFATPHPFAPSEQVEGYHQMLRDLEAWLGEITGYPAVSLQPNAGSQGEYAGLLAIRRYHEARGEGGRDICLIPTSAHGTNPASAVLAGMKVVPVRCDAEGSIDHTDLAAKIASAGESLAALMVTYPSTHGVFEEGIQDVCAMIHAGGGQVYLDGANLNAMVGICRPGDIGADVCHLNLHKTFCIPHGGGGPGMGPIGVAAHLAPFVPGHPVISVHGEGEDAFGPVSAAPWGSASILPIVWMYIRMMGPDGLTRASEVAILSANYIVARLEGEYDVLYRGRGGRVAHECILDIRPFKAVGVQADDIAKWLMDYGFHAPTMSWPVVGTLMVEPTESESREELDRFCDAMLAIRKEVRDIEEGRVAYDDSPLRHAPHTLAVATADTWDRVYTRSQAAFPAPWTREHKYWPYVGRVDNAFGDRNLVCSCDAWLPAEDEKD